MSQHDIEAIEVSLKDAQKAVDLGKALDRLLTNRDFKKVILEGYFEHEAIRLVQLKSAPAMQRPEYQAVILRDIDAIGSLRQHLDSVRAFATQMACEIGALEETRAELLAEELGEAE